MADLDTEYLINEFGRNYPSWVNSAVGPKLDEMVKALNKMAGVKSSNADKEAKNRKQNNEEIDKANKKMDKFSKQMEGLSKGFEKLGKTSVNVTKSLSQGNLTGAVDNLAYSMADLTKGSKGLTSGFGLASAAIIGLGAATNFTIKEMQKTRAAYAAMAEHGMFVRDGFIGLRKAAHEGNMTIEQLNSAASKATTAILSLGPSGIAVFSRLSKAMQDPERLASKLGMNLDAVNEYLAQNLENQRTTGMLNKLNEKQRQLAAERQLKEVTLYSAVLGKSRQQILDESRKALSDPKSQNLMYRIAEVTGQSVEGIRDTSLRVQQQMLAVTNDPAIAKKMADMAMLMYGEQMGVAIVDPAQKAFIAHMKNQAPEIVGVISSTMKDVMLDVDGSEIKENTARLADAFQRGASSLNHSLAQIVMQNNQLAPELSEAMSTLYQIDEGIRGAKIGENLANAEKQMTDSIDPILKTFTEAEQVMRTFNTAISEMATTIAGTDAFRTSISTVNETLDELRTKGIIETTNKFVDLNVAMGAFEKVVGVVSDYGTEILTAYGLYKAGKVAASIGTGLAGSSAAGAANTGIARTALQGLGQAGKGIGRGLMRHPALMAALVGYNALDSIPHDAMASATKDDPELLARLARESELARGIHFEGGRHRVGLGFGPAPGDDVKVGQIPSIKSSVDWQEVMKYMAIQSTDKLLYKNLQDTVDGKIPQFASGGVAKGQTLANIAEAGRPEMVMPLDPALHNMAKYNAEQMVEIYGPFARELNTTLIRNLFIFNRKVIDEILTTTFDKFMYTKNEIEGTMSAIQSGATLNEAQLKTIRGMQATGINVSTVDSSGMPVVGGTGGGYMPDGSGGAVGGLISSGEGGYGSYNRGVAGDSKGTIDFSQMTIKEIMDRQSLRRGDPNRLFAVGKYQVIPSTMKEAVAALGINPNEKLTPELQERIMREYLIGKKRPQIKEYITGKSNDKMAALNAAALEFASVADPVTGRSKYGGVGGNKASISSEKLGISMDQERVRFQELLKQGYSEEEAWMKLSDKVTSGPNKVNMKNGSATRNMDIKGSLKNIFNTVANKLGIDAVDVFSGGQPSKGLGRIGGHRHDNGNAADLKLRMGNRYLDFTNDEDRKLIEKFVEDTVALGVTGVGAGLGYMGPNSLHLGYGSELSWGAKGRSANAPDWLEQARRRGIARRGQPYDAGTPTATSTVVSESYSPNTFGDYPDKGFHNTSPTNKKEKTPLPTYEELSKTLVSLNREINNLSKSFKQGVSGVVV